MYKVYIDTAKRYQTKLVLTKGDKILEEKTGDFDIVSTMAELFAKYTIDPKDVMMDYFTGPGESFTGLKIGSSIANTFNFAVGKMTSKEIKLPNYGREPNISKRKAS